MSKKFILCLIGLASFKLLYLAYLPLDLFFDESYYWDWSRRLDWAYFSKPPMVAAIHYLVGLFASGSDFIIRLPAAILSTLSLLLLGCLVNRWYGAQVALWTLLIYFLSPFYFINSTFMTTDVPLLFFWLLAVGCMVQSSRNEVNSPWVWWSIGLLGGLAFMSKAVAVVFLPLALIWLFAQHCFRVSIKRFSLVLLGFSVVTLPFWVWNMQHDWITFNHMAHHINDQSRSWVSGLAKSLTQMAAMVNPVWFPFLLIGLARGLYQWRKHQQLFVWAGIPLIVYYIIGVFFKTNGNWALLFNVLGCVYLALWIVERPQAWLKKGVMPLAAGVMLVIYLLPFVPVPMWDQVGIKDPFQRFRNYHALAQHGNALIQGSNEVSWVFEGGREVASALAVYGEGNPKVLKWNYDGVIRSQYDLWFSEEKEQLRDEVLWVSDTPRADFPGYRVVSAQALDEGFWPLKRFYYLYLLKRGVEL